MKFVPKDEVRAVSKGMGQGCSNYYVGHGAAYRCERASEQLRSGHCCWIALPNEQFDKLIKYEDTSGQQRQAAEGEYWISFQSDHKIFSFN